MKIEVISAAPERKLVAVAYSEGIYRAVDGLVYRYDFQGRPSKAHQPTGFLTLENLMGTRAGAIPIYEGDSITIQF